MQWSFSGDTSQGYRIKGTQLLIFHMAELSPNLQFIVHCARTLILASVAASYLCQKQASVEMTISGWIQNYTVGSKWWREGNTSESVGHG